MRPHVHGPKRAEAGEGAMHSWRQGWAGSHIPFRSSNTLFLLSWHALSFLIHFASNAWNNSALSRFYHRCRHITPPLRSFLKQEHASHLWPRPAFKARYNLSLKFQIHHSIQRFIRPKWNTTKCAQGGALEENKEARERRFRGGMARAMCQRGWRREE